MRRLRALSPWPQRTTVAAGILLLVSGALLLVEAARPTVAVTETFVIPFPGFMVSLLAALTWAAAFILAATGVHHEVGLAARSLPGRTAMIIWGLRDLTLLLFNELDRSGNSPVGLVIADLALQILFPIAALVAAIANAHARVLVGTVRWVLLPLALVEVLLNVLFDLPATAVSQSLARTFASLPTEFIEPALILLIAVALLTWGRTEALKHRARTIHDAW